MLRDAVLSISGADVLRVLIAGHDLPAHRHRHTVGNVAHIARIGHLKNVPLVIYHGCRRTQGRGVYGRFRGIPAETPSRQGKDFPSVTNDKK